MNKLLIYKLNNLRRMGKNKEFFL